MVRRAAPALLALLLAAGTVAACNTVEGIGQDVKAAGRAIGIGGDEPEEQQPEQ